MLKSDIKILYELKKQRHLNIKEMKNYNTL